MSAVKVNDFLKIKFNMSIDYLGEILAHQTEMLQEKLINVKLCKIPLIEISLGFVSD